MVRTSTAIVSRNGPKWMLIKKKMTNNSTFLNLVFNEYKRLPFYDTGVQTNVFLKTKEKIDKET
jgi:hypothetical protein